jgi:DNA-binding LytR/AlgR family response regulator
VTLRILAVDDERPALDDLARVLRAQPAVAEVDTAASGEEALHALTGEHYDAVFLDVRMPGLDGVELARVLRRFAVPPALIFVSAYESAAVEAFELRALDYLLKPVSRARVAEALARVADALARLSEKPADAPETLAVDVPGGGTRLVRRDDVLYLQAHGDYVRVITADGRFLVRGTLGEIERRWEAHGFHRVHRRFLVNLRRAVEVRPQLNGTAVLILADGAELPIARREVAELRRRLRS